MSPLFDSHAHLSDAAFDSDLGEVIARAQGAGVHRIVNICTDQETLEKGVILAGNPTIFLAAATTPHDAALIDPLFDEVSRLAIEGKLVAIGETGLDYHYERSPKEVQQLSLRRYLKLARESGLPLIIHCRNAFNDLFELLDGEEPVPVLLHCFTGTLEEAQGVIQRGFFLSLSGIVTFKKSESLREVARLTPLSQLLIETDSPYLAPQSERGKRNEPAFLAETARVIAQARGISFDELAAETAANAKRLFRVP